MVIRPGTRFAKYADKKDKLPSLPADTEQAVLGNRASDKMSPAVIPSIIIKPKDARRLGAVDLDQIEALDAFTHIG